MERFTRQGRGTADRGGGILRFERPGITEREVRERSIRLIQRVCPKGYGVEFRRIRRVGDLWEAEGSYRSPDSESPRRFTIRFSLRGTTKFKDIESP